MFTRSADVVEARPGRIEGELVVELGASSLLDVVANGLDAADVAEHRRSDVQLRAPIPRPPSIRDFLSFEEHVQNVRARRGEEVPPEWYEIPVFYFSNPAAIFGPDDQIPYPELTEMLDYELEVAGVIGSSGAIAGFTIMNDWSARDIQRREQRVGLGPAKGKDFATSLGPMLVTTDEFAGREAEMIARVNGEERSRANLRDLFRPWEEIVAYAALNTVLHPGDLIGSGTPGSGCILEHGDGRWLQRGDVVELEVEGLGSLRNQIG